MTPQEIIEYENQAAELRAGFDKEMIDRLWAEGRSLTADQAIEFALKPDTSKTD
jgi:hypothetical protein